MAEETFRFVVLTGPPGCGKTTLVKKVCDVLKSKKLSLNGFFTEEIRMGRERVGFDVVLLSGKRSPLARLPSGAYNEPMVGKYVVKVKSFESFIMPELSSEDKNSVLVLDEIGKMELLSEKFKEFVSQCINSKTGVILATVPLKSVKPIPLVEMLKNHVNACLITVNKDNRNALTDKIANLIISSKEKDLTTQTTTTPGLNFKVKT